jgi:hypothetical protein
MLAKKFFWRIRPGRHLLCNRYGREGLLLQGCCFSTSNYTPELQCLIAAMGFLAPKDQSSNPAPPQVYNWRVYALALSAAMGSSMFGYDSSFIGGSLSLPSFQRRFHLENVSKHEKAQLSANIVSTFQAGCFFGAIFCYFISERLGLKKTLMLCGAVFNVGVILQMAATGQLGLIYAGRALTGRLSRNRASRIRFYDTI